MIQVFVNLAELDVSPDLKVAITYQAADIGGGDLASRKASFTNQISVPKTSNNRTILGVSDDIHSTDLFPFVVNDVHILSNGIEILSGNCELINVGERFQLRIFQVIKDLVVVIGDKVLDELDFEDSPITWDAAYWDGARASTSGLCAPVIQYGQIDFTIANGTIGTVYLPSVSYKDILTEIMEEAGYTLSGTFYTSDTIFNNMVMTYGRKIWPGTSFQINEILPDDIMQIDFVRDFLVRFGAYFRIVNTDIEIVLLEDILNDTANAIDWTDKRANDKFDLSFQWDGWAGQNVFTQAEGEGKLFGDIFNSGSIVNGNLNLKSTRTVYGSLFVSQGLNSSYGNVSYNIASVQNIIYCATLLVWDAITNTGPTTYEFDEPPVPMLCILRDPDPDGLAENSIIYNVTPRTDYKIAYYGDALHPSLTFGESMHWRGKSFGFVPEMGFLDNYYQTLGFIMETPKKVIRQYKLSDIDIYSLDLLVPIYDDGDYFLINKVSDYVPGRLTEVELLRIYYES